MAGRIKMEMAHLVLGALLSSYPCHLRSPPTGTRIPILQMKTLRLRKVKGLAGVLQPARKVMGPSPPPRPRGPSSLTLVPVATSPLSNQATAGPVPFQPARLTARLTVGGDTSHAQKRKSCHGRKNHRARDRGSVWRAPVTSRHTRMVTHSLTRWKKLSAAQGTGQPSR